MSEPLRYGLIGAGGMGRTHLKTLETFEAEGLIRLVCVADPFVERLAESKARLESRGVRWHTSFETLLEQERELDVVVICTPIPLHSKMMAAALARSLLVYLEKPPVPLIQQLNDLVALDPRHKAAVAFQWIDSQQIQCLKKWKVDGALGEVKHISVTGIWPRLNEYYQRAAWAGRMQVDDEPVFDGPGTNALSHFLHCITFLAGQTMEGFDVPSEVAGEFYNARPIESYDTLCMKGRMESGITFSFAVSHACEQKLPVRLEIVGSKGKAWLCNDGDEVGNDVGLTSPVPPYEIPFNLCHRRFIEYAQGKRPRATTQLEDTRGYVLATNAALVASGRIHHIRPEFWKTYGEGNKQGYHIYDVKELIERSAVENKLFSEMGAPWALKGESVSVRGLRSIRLKDYLQ